MKAEVKLEVRAEDFWKVIKDSIRQDAGKGADIYQGLTFEKKLPTTLSGEVTAKVAIVEYKENQCYAADFITARSTVHSSYKIIEDGEGIVVTYEEEESFHKKLDQWNGKLMHSIYKKSRTKKLIKKLKNIEKHIKGEL